MSELVRQLPIAGAPTDLEVTGVQHDSRRVAPGDLFVAIRGARFDGRAFAGQAAERGAVAVLGEGDAPPGFHGVWLRTEEPRRLLGPLAARVYGHPDRELTLIGVTGTNGKSTIVALIASILEADGRTAGRMGTLGSVLGDRQWPILHTTPEASDLFAILRQMRDSGADAVAMEVSSHALALGRVDGAAFDLALFANLSRDHFDFHSDFEEYFAAKRQLFGRLKPAGAAVVNVDDPRGAGLARELPGALTFGANGAVHSTRAQLDEQGIRATLATPRGPLQVVSPLLGRFNLENLTAAVAAAEALGVARDSIVRGVAACRPLPGRMEPVSAGQPFGVYIDYAHTDAALAAAIRSLKELSGCRVIVVFGCGGDRDPGKRPLMGRVAGELAERAILTSDNPRGEDPQRILEQVEEGLRDSGRPGWETVPDRRRAIRRAVELAGPGWAVLVAGKGHEQEQIVGDRRLPFSDRLEVMQALEERFGARTSG